ncbi:cupin domain-containing protein [Streptomyces sp. NPDC051362]|uniref:cupin domain-containing protein n=1 Tax=Streptomyces sp. NPDC051362 TaxID=3365651 RepID=UPI00379E12E2
MRSPEPERAGHEGYEWIYVLDGRLRLVLGDNDLTMGPGEATEFDTRTPQGGPVPGSAGGVVPVRAHRQGRQLPSDPREDQSGPRRRRAQRSTRRRHQ